MKHQSASWEYRAAAVASPVSRRRADSASTASPPTHSAANSTCRYRPVMPSSWLAAPAACPVVAIGTSTASDPTAHSSAVPYPDTATVATERAAEIGRAHV